MILDVTGIPLVPGNNGKDCLGNGEKIDEYGNLIPCCCDECDYMQCCLESHSQDLCRICTDEHCPRHIKWRQLKNMYIRFGFPFFKFEFIDK